MGRSMGRGVAWCTGRHDRRYQVAAAVRQMERAIQTDSYVRPHVAELTIGARLVILCAVAMVACTQTRQPTVSPSGVEQTAQGTRPPATLVASFDGLGVGLQGPHGRWEARNPSDNSLAVGRDYVFQIVNTRMAIFRKNGEIVYGPVPTNTLFKGFGGACEAHNNGDAVVRYDQLADRWLIVMPVFTRSHERPDQPALWKASDRAYISPPGVPDQPGAAAPLFVPPAVPPSPPAPPDTTPRVRPPRPPEEKGPFSICYAMSTSPDPLGSYYRYEFLRPLFPDYPRPAVWPDGYYVPTSTGDDVIQKHTCAVDRRHMLLGEAATEQCMIVDCVNFLNHADLDGRTLPPAGAPNVVLAAGGTQLHGIFDDDGIYAWRFSVDWTDPRRSATRRCRRHRRCRAAACHRRPGPHWARPRAAACGRRDPRCSGSSRHRRSCTARSLPRRAACGGDRRRRCAFG